jgi:hypothetical protein
MSKHHTLPPIIYTPPPKPNKTEKKRRIGIGLLNEFDETADTPGTSDTGQPMPSATRLSPENFPEIEGADRKPHYPPGRLSQSTLSVLLRAQELK